MARELVEVMTKPVSANSYGSLLLSMVWLCQSSSLRHEGPRLEWVHGMEAWIGSGVLNGSDLTLTCVAGNGQGRSSGAMPKGPGTTPVASPPWVTWQSRWGPETLGRLRVSGAYFLSGDKMTQEAHAGSPKAAGVPREYLDPPSRCFGQLAGYGPRSDLKGSCRGTGG